MTALAIGLLWLCIGVIILGGVIFIILSVIKKFFAIPEKIEYAVWAIFFILILIDLLSMLQGGAGGLPHPNFFR
jgi:hypothetical protein